MSAKMLPTSLSCGTQLLYFNLMIFRLEDLSLVEKTLSLKAYNNIRRATDIISHSSSERRSIFNASQWSKPSNVSGCFIACIEAHSPGVELDNAIRFRLWSGPL